MGRTKIVTAENILQNTNWGLDIFQREILNLKINKPFKNPKIGDKHGAAFIVKQGNFGYYWKDYRTGEWGNAINFIMYMHDLSFKDAIAYIQSNNYVKNEAVYEVKSKKTNKVVIDWEPTSFGTLHKSYWMRYGLPEDFLNAEDIYAVNKYAINGNIKKIMPHQAVFAYEAKDINEVKLLSIGRNVSKKWINTAPNTYIWNWDKSNLSPIWICKSKKDAAVLKYHFNLNTCSVQNEDASIFLENNYEVFEEHPAKKIVTFGSDFHGWHNSLLITHLTNWHYFNTPNRMYDKFAIEDPADYLAAFGKKALEKLINKTIDRL